MTGTLTALAPAASARVAGSPAPAATAGPAPTRPHIMPRRPVTAERGTIGPAETKVCDQCVPPLVYSGGPVMGTAATTGEVTVTPIFWAPGGPSAFPAGYTALVDRYLGDVAAASGASSNVYSTDTEYYQSVNGQNSTIHYLIHAGSEQDDTTAYPASQCKVNPGMQACIDDPQLQAELGTYLAAHSLPTDMAHLYPVFFPPNIATGDGSGGLSLTTYCGYHSLFNVGTQPVVYANEPYLPDGCGASQSPNNSLPADAGVDTLSHEINESITDPNPNSGWADSAGNENGDQCSSDFGDVLGSTDPAHASTTGYNQVINGDKYYTQEEFSNTDFASGPNRGCVQSESAVGGVPTPKNTVTVTANPASLPADPSASSAVTVKVTDATGNPVAGDLINLSVGTAGQTGAVCGELQIQSATTDASGQVTDTYGASADNVTCNVGATEVATGQAGKAVITQGAGSPPPTGQAYHALSPTRLADTRPGNLAQGSGTPVTFGQSLNVVLPSSVPAGATAVVSVTALDATAGGYLTVYPTGGMVPGASSLDYVAGSPGCNVADCFVPNLVTVPVGAGGQISVFNGPGLRAGSTDVIVDLQGYYSAADRSSGAGHYDALTPARLADSRCSSAPAPTFCGGEQLPTANAAVAAPGGHSGISVAVAGQDRVATSASAVVANVTVTDTRSPGYLTAFPDGIDRPMASNLNWVAGQTTANRVIVPVGADGNVTLYNGSAAPADVIVDVVGYYSGAAGSATVGSLFNPVDPIRVGDTRASSGLPDAGKTLGAGTNLATQFTGTNGIPQGASAVVVNLTGTDPTAPSFFTVSPAATVGRPSSSDLNLATGETRANADLATLSAAGSANLYNLAGRADAIMDLAGYFTPAGS
ncbi:MAG: hypothetical protein M3Y91_09365 [Actinomycetota bacterium]|nr:hypothetical protein [Actinomycetota bacterium]